MNDTDLLAAQATEMSAVTLTYMGVGVVLLALLKTSGKFSDFWWILKDEIGSLEQ